MRRIGVIGGILIFVLWLGAWIFLSDLPAKAWNAAKARTLEVAAAAGFAIDDIIVEGRKNTDPAILQALLNTQRGDPILAFNTESARELLEQISWVKHAHIERRLPGTIFIRLEERTPLALWQYEQKIRLIDREAVILTEDNLDRFRDLVMVVGKNAPAHAPELLDLLEAEPVLAPRVAAATWIGDRRWNLTLENGIIVKLPEKDIGLALRRVAKTHKADQLLDKDILTVDARTKDRIIVRTRPGTAGSYNEQGI